MRYPYGHTRHIFLNAFSVCLYLSCEYLYIPLLIAGQRTSTPSVASIPSTVFLELVLRLQPFV